MHASGGHAQILTGPAGNSPNTRWIVSLIASQHVSYLTRLSNPLIRGTVFVKNRGRSSTRIDCRSRSGDRPNAYLKSLVTLEGRTTAKGNTCDDIEQEQ